MNCILARVSVGTLSPLRLSVARWILVVWPTMLIGQAAAEDTFNQAPIHYQTAQPSDRVHQLAQRLEKGEASLRWEPQRGWLSSVLETLNLPIESQTLVFSKTSLQFFDA